MNEMRVLWTKRWRPSFTLKWLARKDRAHYGQLLITAEAAQDVGTNGYAYRRSIAINHAKVSRTDQANFPVLISGGLKRRL